MRRKRGFTLIELMIVVAIIAILAAIAVPWWGKYTYRARRADGQKLLVHVAQMEERYFTDHNQYTTDPKELGYTVASGSPIPSEHDYYEVTLAPNGGDAGTSYLATAAPVHVQLPDVCGNLTIDNTGLKTPIPTNAAANSNGNCW